MSISQQEFYGNLFYNPLLYPKRPSDLVVAGKLGEFIPAINDRPELLGFLSTQLLYNSDPERKKERYQHREQFLDQFGLSNVIPFSHRIPIKLAIFDVDENIARLYGPINAANEWAITRLVRKHDLPLEDVRKIVKGTLGEFGCHAPYELLHLVAEETGYKKLSPDNKANQEVVADWRYARLALTQQALFKDTIPTFEAIKKEGGLVYLSTASMPASLFERLYLWFGEKNIHLIDGIAVSKSMDGIKDESIFATKGEKAFVKNLMESGKVMMVDVEKVKPHPLHVEVALDHANAHLPKGARPITPAECFLADDSPTALGSARKAGMHSVENIAAVMGDQKELERHALWGCNRNERGLDAFINKHKPHQHEDIVVRRLGELLDVFQIVPLEGNWSAKPRVQQAAHGSNGATHAGANAKTKWPSYVQGYEAGEKDDKRPWGKWETLAVGYLPVSQGGLAFCDKAITVNPGGKLSMQLHIGRREDWFIAEGKVTVYLGKDPKNLETHILTEGQTIHIPEKTWHSLTNTGTKPAVFYERQTGILLHEKDNVRRPTAEDPRTTDKAAMRKLSAQIKELGLEWPEAVRTRQSFAVAKPAHAGLQQLTGT